MPLVVGSGVGAKAPRSQSNRDEVGGASNPPRGLVMGKRSAGSTKAPRLAHEARCRVRASRRGYPTGGGTPPFGKMVM
jgi:hypothetical protein